MPDARQISPATGSTRLAHSAPGNDVGAFKTRNAGSILNGEVAQGPAKQFSAFSVHPLHSMKPKILLFTGLRGAA